MGSAAVADPGPEPCGRGAAGDKDSSIKNSMAVVQHVARVPLALSRLGPEGARSNLMSSTRLARGAGARALEPRARRAAPGRHSHRSRDG